MGKDENVNVVDVKQLEKAEFKKMFGNDEKMYDSATDQEIIQYLQDNPEDLHVFVVPRENPVTSERFIPKQLLQPSAYNFVAQPGEFFVFQVVVWAPKTAAFHVRAESHRAVNFMKPSNLRNGEVKIFWFGLDVPSKGYESLTEDITIYTDNLGSRKVQVDIQIQGEILLDRGESDDERMARLRWLNSDIGKEDTVFAPYIPLQREGNTISWLGHTMTLGKNGLPQMITSDVCGETQPLLNAPIKIEANDSEFQGEFTFEEEKQTSISWKCEGKIGKCSAILKGYLEFDGYLEFSLITSGTGNFKLHIDCSKHDYLVGLGQRGCEAPKRFDWFWDQRAWQDGCWLGNTEGGIRLRLRDSKYKQPPTGCYYHFSELNLPEAWYNEGKGGITLQENMLTAFSGDITENRELEFGFDLQITPFHKMDLEKHLQTHIWHPCMHTFEIGGSDPLLEADFLQLKKEGVNRINVHHAVEINPFINYPFSNVSMDKLIEFVERAHEYGMEVAIYYTLRELSVHPAEFWAFRAMGNEIFQEGLGIEARPITSGGSTQPWLSENILSPYIPAWAETIKNGPACNNKDIALVTTPESKRLENFYLEGLRYLLERCPIDGLYMDDSSLSREGYQRLYRVFYKYRKKAPTIDFHAWNPYKYVPKGRDFGRCSVILRDMHNLPYFTQLWLGETYDYENTSPDYYLTEISGIPFGTPSQMLNDGGNPWRGILYGMTGRYGWFGYPCSIWEYFEKFGLSGIKMELDAAFPTELPTGIRVTRFTNDENNCCYAVASWAETPVKIDLELSGCRVVEIPGFQTEGQCIIEPGKGLILTC